MLKIKMRSINGLPLYSSFDNAQFLYNFKIMCLLYINLYNSLIKCLASSVKSHLL